MTVRSFPDTRIRLRARCLRAGRGEPVLKTGRGFALIEALVALLLFSLGILGLIGLQARSISIAGDAEDRSRAALIADQCASAMQLQANSIPLASASTLAGVCQTPAWTAFVANPAQGGLPNGVIAIGSLITDARSSDAAIAPAGFNITVSWAPPARVNASKSQFQTRVTLLLKSS